MLGVLRLAAHQRVLLHGVRRGLIVMADGSGLLLRGGGNGVPFGLGIAFHAKPKVKATAEQSISTIGLDGILYFLGYKDSYLEN